MIEIAMTNAAMATLLGGAAWIAMSKGVDRRWPVFVHAVWVIVLIRFLAPPILPLAIDPPFEFSPASSSARGQETPAPLPILEHSEARMAEAVTVLDVQVVKPSGLFDGISLETLKSVGAAVWLTGTLVLLAFILLGALRMSRIPCRPVPAWLEERARELARRMSLRRQPVIAMHDRRIGPAVWCFLGKPRIVLPRVLLDRLDREQLDTVIAHEFVHVCRGDHLVRHLELAVCSVFWWHPLAWIARRSLRRVEERCCDVRVLALLPGSGQAYAKALIESCELTNPSAVSGFGSGATHEKSDIKERLTSIMRTTPSKLATHEPHRYRLGKLVVVAAGLFAIAIFPSASTRVIAREDVADFDLDDPRQEAAESEMAHQETAESEIARQEERLDEAEYQAMQLEQEAELRERAELELQTAELDRLLEEEQRYLAERAVSDVLRDLEHERRLLEQRIEEEMAKVESQEAARRVAQGHLEEARIRLADAERARAESARHVERRRVEREERSRARAERDERHRTEREVQIRVEREVFDRAEREREREREEAVLADPAMSDHRQALADHLERRVAEMERILEELGDDGSLTERLEEIRRAARELAEQQTY